MTQAPQGKSKMLAGILNIVIPGVGTMIIGYLGKGIAQLLLSFCCVGTLWSWWDAYQILTGKINKDSQGNPLV